MSILGPPYDLTASPIGPLEVELAWTNAGYHDSTRIERKIVGGQYSEIVSVDGNDTSFRDGSIADGTAYVYRVRAETGGEYTEYSNEAEVSSALPAPTGLDGYPRPTGGVEGEPMTEAVLSWVDNSQNEESFHVYKGETLIEETAANATSFIVTGLTPKARYRFRVRAFKSPGYSPWSNSVWITMGDPPNAPSKLTATPVGIVGIVEIQLEWMENADNEIDFHIEQSTTSETEGFAEIDTVGANITFYRVLDLIPGTQYWYRVRTHNESGYSEYSNVATATTKDQIAAPTNLVCTPAKIEEILVGVECVWDDNSFDEDRHEIQRKTGEGEWQLITHDQTILHPNETYFHDHLALSGVTYTYRVYATKDEVNTLFSNEVTITVPGVPAPPTNLTVSEYQDTWARLTWTPTTGEVGYSIEMSTTSELAGFAEIMRICAGIEGLKIPSLTASTQYWFRIRAYNMTENPNYQIPGGYQDYVYSNVATVTTRALYLPSKFERLIKKSKPRLIFLVEANPLMEITGWLLTTDEEFTYETEFNEDGAALIAVYENGVALAAKTSIVDVEETAGTYWHDIANKKVYLHTTAGIDPANFLITGSFWLFFTTWQRGSTVYNGNNYLPLVAKDGIPDISQTIQPFYKGTFAVSSGTLNLINGKVRKAFYFDQRFSRYLWLNRKVKILAGGEDFTYLEFAPIHTGSINSTSIDDRRMSLDLRDFRDGLRRDLPVEKYSLDTLPAMDEQRVGTERPFGFGAITNAVAVCIDTESRIFEFHAGRVKSLLVTKNDEVLGAGTDYFIDYQRGRITLALDLPYDATADRIIVNFTGDVNTADEANVSGAEIFLDICRMWMGCQLEDMDLDAIYATKIAKPTALSLYLHKTQDSGDAVRVIEQSTQSYTMQDGAGRLGIRAEQTTPASGAPYVWNVHVFDFEAIKNQDPLFSEIKLHYAENPASDFYFQNQIIRPPVTWRHGINKSLDVYIASADLEVAFEAGLAIANAMERPPISFTIPRVLYTCLPGDVIPFNRTRFPSLTGTAVNLPIKILGISKLISSGKTAITAEVMS